MEFAQFITLHAILKLKIIPLKNSQQRRNKSQTDNFRAIVHKKLQSSIINLPCTSLSLHFFALIAYPYSLYLSYQDTFICNLTNDFIFVFLAGCVFQMVGRRGLEPLCRTSSLWATHTHISKKGIEPFNVIDSFYTTAVARLSFRHCYQLSTLIYHQCIAAP